MRRPVALLLFAAALPAAAHDLWLERDGGDFVLRHGHRHAAAHAGPEAVAYAPSAVRAARCVEDAGGSRALPQPSAAPARLAGGCAALLVAFSTGEWTKTPWRTENRPKGAVADALDSWRAEESLKRIERWLPATARPLGAALELTPLADPFAARVGDKLSVLVTAAGRPLAGVPVAYDGNTRGVSDADGRIAIRVRHGGLQALAASIELPLADGRADRLLRSAGLQFELPQ